MKRALVTGGTGFVGANLARRLLREGHEVHLLVRGGYQAWRIQDIVDSLRLHAVPLDDAERLREAIRAIRPEWVFHLAAHGAYSWQTGLQAMIETNLVGTIHLVEACLEAGIEAFVNTGSSSEYGFKDHAPSETEWLEPNSHYAVTKASATLFCAYTARQHRVPMPTLRLYSVYGPWEEPHRLMPALILQGLKGRLPPLAHPAIARDYVHVDDVSEAYLRAAQTPDQEPDALYNVGTGVQTTLQDAVETTRRLLGVQAEPQWASMPDRPWDTTSWVADSRKIRETLGWQPAHSFEEGFRMTVDWFRSRPDLWPRYE